MIHPVTFYSVGSEKVFIRRTKPSLPGSHCLEPVNSDITAFVLTLLDVDLYETTSDLGVVQKSHFVAGVTTAEAKSKRFSVVCMVYKTGSINMYDTK